MRTLAFLTILAAAGIVLTPRGVSSGSPVKVHVPGIVLWAWERPEDLAFIDPDKVGVAFLARSVELSGDQVKTRSRMQPFRVPPGTRLIAVVRLTTNSRSVPSFSESQKSRTAAEMLRASRIAGARGVQIDFDATVSERPFYRSLLIALRRKLPDSVSLSITALASWCLSDAWIADLPVDDAIPMLFRLGPDRAAILRHLRSGGDFSLPVCRQSIGVSVDEPFPAVMHGRRVYLFNPKPWTRETFQLALKELGR